MSILNQDPRRTPAPSQRRRSWHKAWPKVLFNLSLPLGLAAFATPSAAATSNSLEKDIGTLAGEWQGQAVDGTRLKMSFAPGHDSLMMTGTWEVDGGAFATKTDISLVRAGTFYFLMPEASPFIPAATSAKSPYSLLRLPGGGFRFVRLAHVEVGNLQGLQSEEILIGKKHADGTRTVKLVSSDKLCADATVPAGKVCGEAISEQIVMRKITP